MIHSMKTDRFKFKKFSVSHSNSSMKVGIDSILLGCWSDLKGTKKILDVGTGCGLLALMCAQRNPEAIIEAIDVDPSSVTEATENFESSEWSKRLLCFKINFNEFKGSKYDLIISNPPYFKSGISEVNNPRERARHQDSLSPEILIKHGVDLLSGNGKISMIIPTNQATDLKEHATKHGLSLSRITIIHGREDLPSKRAMLEFVLNNSRDNIGLPKAEHLILEDSLGQPTKEFKELCKEFYLKF